MAWRDWRYAESLAQRKTMYALTGFLRAKTVRCGRKTANEFWRTSAALVAALGVAACAGNSVNRQPSVQVMLEPEQSPTQLALRNMLSKQGGEAGAPYRSEAVVRFYKSRNFQPAWSQTTDNETQGREIRAVLARAHEHGLRDEDYAPPKNDSRLEPGAKAAAYEMTLTDAVLRYAHDVKVGHVRADDIYMDVLLPAPKFDAAADLTAAVNAHSVTAFLSDLAPSHPEYRRLAQALARYRAIADEGGWASLPGKGPIKLEASDPRLPLLAKRLAFEDPVLAAIANPSVAEIREAVKRFQSRNGLEDDGRVGGGTLAALEVPASSRVAQITANMERWRWMPREFEPRYVAVNVPDQSLAFVSDGKRALSSKVIVGTPMSPTPIIRTQIVAVVANPPWNIPGDIAARDLLPHLVKSPNYLATKHMVVTDGPPGDPYGRTINWKNIVPAEFPYAIQQLPGPATALGALMLDSPNDFDVYLHDTPNKKRFDSDMREISNGCVRVQQIIPLASLALTGDAAKGMSRLNQVIKTRETQRLTLDAPLPVYFLYWTALAGEDGTTGFRTDFYGRDAPLIAALSNKAGKAAKPAEMGLTGDPQMIVPDELSP
jgi:murein L,D-transpeptidase YcbB/YkuD